MKTIDPQERYDRIVIRNMCSTCSGSGKGRPTTECRTISDCLPGIVRSHVLSSIQRPDDCGGGNQEVEPTTAIRQNGRSRDRSNQAAAGLRD